MNNAIQWDSLSKETKAIVQDAFESNDLTEEQLDAIKKDGLTKEVWDNSPLSMYLGGKLPEELSPTETVEEIDEEKEITKEEAENAEWFTKLKRSMQIYDEKILNVTVRRRGIDGKYNYVKGGYIKWNAFQQTYIELLERISQKFGQGDYYFTFSPSRKSKLKQFSKTESIVDSNVVDAGEEKSYVPSMPVPQPNESIKDIMALLMGQMNNLFATFQNQSKEQNNEFKNTINQNSAETLLVMKQMAKAISSFETTGQQSVPQKQSDIFEALEAITTVVERLHKQVPKPAPTTQAPVGQLSTLEIDKLVREGIAKGISEHRKAVQEGISLATSIREEEEYEEPETPPPSEPAPEVSGLDIPKDAGLGEVADIVIKDALGTNLQELIKVGLTSFKDYLSKLSTRQVAEITPQPEQIPQQPVQVEGAEAPPEDVKVFMMAANALEKKLATDADMEIALWIKSMVAPAMIPKFREMTAERFAGIFTQLNKQKMLEEIPRILRIIKMIP